MTNLNVFMEKFHVWEKQTSWRFYLPFKNFQWKSHLKSKVAIHNWKDATATIGITVTYAIL